MELEKNTDSLDARLIRLKKEGTELTDLQSSVAENKEASAELEKSLDQLEATTKKLEDQSGGS
jgi:hypothetical protein